LDLKKKEKNNMPSIAESFVEILRSLNIDLADANFTDTPNRVQRVYEHLCLRCVVGPEKDLESIKKLTVTFPSTAKNLVVVKNIKAYSVCPHHFLPVEYRVDFGYIPDASVVGLSKIPRLIKYLAKKPALQEDFVEEIVDVFEQMLKPLGCMSIVRGFHGCMKFRGIEEPNSPVITSAIKGVFKNPPEGKNPRQEMLDLLNVEENSG
jgi:GTP cyclohydrolase I